jgi:alkylation response protein AidB-like acyl-CoA dehydrogenase
MPHGPLARALADFAPAGPREPSAWQRLAPHRVHLEEPLAGIEAALDEPEIAALLVRLAAAEEYPAPVLERLRARGLAAVLAEDPDAPPAASRVTFWHVGALNAAAARRDGSLAITIGVNGLALLPAYIAATPEQLRRIFARVRGGASASMLLTELAHGSNLLANEARATREGEAYRLDGEKDLINGASRHELLFVLARTGDAGRAAGAAEAPLAGRGDFTFLFVERGAGVEALPRWRTLPAPAADIAGVRFSGTRVPLENAIGGEGEGFPVVQKALAVSRGGIGALASGAASRARELAAGYAERRAIYERGPISSLGAIAAHLARLEALDVAVAALALKATAAVNALGLGAAHYTAAAKLVCCALAEEAVAEGRRVLGSRALLRDLPYEPLVRDVLLYGVFDGTGHLMLDQLAWRLAQAAGPAVPAAGDTRPETARIYAAPPRRLVEVLRARARPFVAPAEAHARALGHGPLAEVAGALVATTRALREAGRWDADQAVRFDAAEALGLLEAALATLELTQPEVRAALGVPGEVEPRDALAGRRAVGMLGARAAVRVRGLALREGIAPPPGLVGAEGALASWESGRGRAPRTD